MIFYRQQSGNFATLAAIPAHCAHQQFRKSGRAVAQSMTVAKFSSKAPFCPPG